MTLDHREYGEPGGYPVVNNHGGLVCGLDISTADGAARELGLRIISPDRPGVGGSSPQPGRRTVDWPRDVAALLDSLGVTRCGAFGWSLGSDYALALGAAGVADRVVVVGGMPPLTPARLAQLNSSDRAFTWLSHHQPVVARAIFATMGKAAAATHAATARLSGVDDEVVRSLAEFPEWMRVGMRQPQGVVEEYRTMSRPWGFEPADVRCAVDVWHGDQDTYVPIELGRELAAGLPDATLHEVTGAGHFLAYTRWEEVLAPFAA